MSGTTPATLPATHTPGGTPISLPPVGGTGSTTAPGGTTTASRIRSVHITTFSFPHGISLPLFDGSDWATWAGTLEAILVLHEADDIILHDTCPVGILIDEWAAVSRRAKAYLCPYIKPDIYSLIASEIDYP